MDISVVIIVSRHDAAGTERTIQSVTGIDADILLYDVTRTAIAEPIATRYGIRYATGEWDGYEQVRYRALLLAKFDWILMLHTSEVPNKRLLQSIQKFNCKGPAIAYRIRFINLFEERSIRYGVWINDFRLRFGNRTCVKIEDRRLSEAIFSKQGVSIMKMRGAISHISIKNQAALQRKTIRDAMLSALKYYRLNRKPGMIRQAFSPLFSFVQSYFMKLGFMDGWSGFLFASKSALYSRLKYKRLKELQAAVKKPI